MNTERAGRFVEDAYRLAELGWALIRLDGKIPKGKDWQHTEPLSDPHQAAGMWAEWGKRWNMGVVLGPSRLCVIEYDRDEAEPVLLDLLGGDWPTTPTVRTGSGRRHLYFEVPPNGVSKAARDGLELRLGAHQCVVPPSEHPDRGIPYVWELEPWSTPLLTVPADALAVFAAAPDELRERLRVDPDAKIQAGQRRDQVFRLACSLVARGVPRDAILTAARAFNETRCEPPLEDAQVVDQVDGAVGRYEPATALAGTSEVYTPAKVKSVAGGAGVISHPSLSSQSATWPDALDADAYHGLVGEIVQTLEPHTEADPVAILSQTLVAYGNAVGRTPYALVEGDRHYLNLYACLVGDTAKARKGTSWGRARAIVSTADPEWECRIKSGLSSGEGLIAQVAKGEESEESDESLDPRLLVVESEFVSALKVAGRDGNTLSAIIRAAWDTGSLRTLTRHSPLEAEGAHVSIIGHITAEELRRYLDATETANGFANRFLWLCVRRSKLLPEGGSLPPADVERYGARMREAIAFARRCGQIQRSPQTRELWASEYERLSAGESGLVGALLARSEAQVLRLSLLYALLDRAKLVQPEHLRAALALWRYSERSVRFLFGDSTGNPDADVILRALRENRESGLTRTEISSLFGRHASAARIGRALDLLHEKTLAATPETETTGGRPVERWRAAQ
ncbi:MAG TPA: bifunctional DNA primase/polymerase [Gaiellaceae bacterium]|nr:bifunctional DNA primase/polymerase [Gaiellaceae bacterium]